MGVRKKTAKKGQSGKDRGAEARALAVVIEQQHGHFKVFGEALQGLREEMHGRFDAIDRRFDGVDREIAFVKGELSVVKSDLSDVKSELSVVKTDLSLVKIAVLETSREMKGLRVAVEDLDARKADRHEIGLPPGG